MPADTTPSGPTRRMPVALLFVAGTLLLIRIGLGIFAPKHEASVPEHIQWRPIALADSLSRLEGKPVLYDFTADWCPPCQAMKRELFADERAAEQINRLFVPVQVVDRAREEGKNPPAVAELQSRYQIDGFPTLVATLPEGEPVILSGYGGREETLQRLVDAAIKLRLANQRQNSR